jgi:hypothetical protein
MSAINSLAVVVSLNGKRREIRANTTLTVPGMAIS